MKPQKSNKSVYISFAIILYLGVVFFTLHYCAMMRERPDIDILTALNDLTTHVMENPFDVVFDFKILSTVTVVFACSGLLLYTQSEANRHDCAGKEAGSASWNTDYKGYNKQFTSPFGKVAHDGEDNMILSQNIRLSMNGYETNRNNNILVIGGSGSGKSRFFVKPNILQYNCSFVVSDPKGEMLECMAGALEKEGYRIKVFNTIEMAYSDCYNPFVYMHDEKDIIKAINCLVMNTTPKGASTGDPFWQKSETALLTALAAFLCSSCPMEDRNWHNVTRLLDLAYVDENNSKALSTLDILFKIHEVELKRDAEKRDEMYEPDLCLRQYAIFKQAAGKTAMSILVSAAVRLANFTLHDISRLTNTDTIDLPSIGDKKTALFCVISSSDSTFNFLVSLLYTQLFDELYMFAQNKHGGRLPVQVRFLLDEFANTGRIPGFDVKLATMRSYGISCSIILQSLGQLKAMYKDEWETVVGNCDSKVILGVADETTTKYVSGMLGQGTITSQSRSQSTGRQGSSSKSFQQTARSLLTPDEVSLVDNRYCIVQIRGLKPFFDKKYKYEQHPHFKETGDGAKENIYPFRDIYRKRNEEAEAKKKQARLEKKLEAKKQKEAQRQFDETRKRILASKKKGPIKQSSCGTKLLVQQDAGTELAKNPDRTEKLMESYMPAEFDSAFEFRDGRGDISDDEFLAVVEQSRVMVAQEET